LVSGMLSSDLQLRIALYELHIKMDLTRASGDLPLNDGA
jgi:hypothetical protein